MKKLPSTTWIVLLSVCAIVLALGAYFARTAIYNELNNLKLIPTPERFTELYFQNPNFLPTSTTAGQTMSFAFTISNVEGTSTAYPYEVYFAYPNGEHVMFVSSTVTLSAGASTTIPIAHTFNTSNLTGSVVVDLTSLNNQEIDFLLPNTNE